MPVLRRPILWLVGIVALAVLVMCTVGGHTPKSGGRVLDGRTWDEYPVRSA